MSFVSRGFFTPSGGPTEGLTLGTINRGNGGDASSMVITIVDNTSVLRGVPESGKKVDLRLTVETVGAQTSADITMTMDKYAASTRAGIYLYDATIATIEADLAARNTGWAVDITDTGSTYTINFTKASLAAGSLTLYVSSSPSNGAWWWSYDTGSADYTAAVSVVGSSTEVPSATGDSYTASIGDIVLSQSYSPDPGTEDAAVQFTCTYDNVGGGVATNQMVIQLSAGGSSANLTSPTTISNPNSWTIGTWTDAGTYWESTCTRAAGFSGSNSITFSTTPSTAMTLQTSIAATNLVWASNHNGSVVVNASFPAYASAGTAASGAGNFTPGGTGASGNDVEILVVVQGWVSGMSDATLNTANGFAAITGGGVDSGGFGGVYCHTTTFWRRGGGSDPVVSNTFYGLGRIYKYTGVVTTGNPWDVVATTGDNDNDTSVSLTGATTTVTNTLVVAALGAFCQATGASFASWANANLGSLTERDDTAYSVSGEDMNLALTTGTKATASAIGATTATASGVGTWFLNAGVVIALKPV